LEKNIGIEKHAGKVRKYNFYFRRITSPPTSPIQDLDDMDSVQPRVEMLQESPGAGRNRRQVESNQLRVSF
jgi:hypothetical protein